MTVPLTLDLALRLLPTVAGIARAGVRLTAEGHQRHALAIAARRAANEIGIATAAAAIGAVESPRLACAVRPDDDAPAHVVPSTVPASSHVAAAAECVRDVAWTLTARDVP